MSRVDALVIGECERWLLPLPVQIRKLHGKLVRGIERRLRENAPSVLHQGTGPTQHQVSRAMSSGRPSTSVTSPTATRGTRSRGGGAGSTKAGSDVMSASAASNLLWSCVNPTLLKADGHVDQGGAPPRAVNFASFLKALQHLSLPLAYKEALTLHNHLLMPHPKDINRAVVDRSHAQMWDDQQMGSDVARRFNSRRRRDDGGPTGRDLDYDAFVRFVVL